MTKYFKEITKNFETFILYVEDNIYQLKVGIRIMYKPKTNIIKNVTFDKISEKNLLNYLNFCYKEISEFEIL